MGATLGVAVARGNNLPTPVLAGYCVADELVVFDFDGLPPGLSHHPPRGVA